MRLAQIEAEVVCNGEFDSDCPFKDVQGDYFIAKDDKNKDQYSMVSSGPYHEKYIFNRVYDVKKPNLIGVILGKKPVKTCTNKFTIKLASSL